MFAIGLVSICNPGVVIVITIAIVIIVAIITIIISLSQAPRRCGHGSWLLTVQGCMYVIPWGGEEGSVWAGHWVE